MVGGIGCTFAKSSRDNGFFAILTCVCRSARRIVEFRDSGSQISIQVEKLINVSTWIKKMLKTKEYGSSK